MTERNTEKDLTALIKGMKPRLHPGEYVFCTVPDLNAFHFSDILLAFREEEGITIIIKRDLAENLGLPYSFVASWITLMVHSSLTAVGFTAAFSKALTDHGISCNVVAGFHHDHIFIDKKDASHAMQVLNSLAGGTSGD